MDQYPYVQNAVVEQGLFFNRNASQTRTTLQTMFSKWLKSANGIIPSIDQRSKAGRIRNSVLFITDGGHDSRGQRNVWVLLKLVSHALTYVKDGGK